ncbi:MAG: metal ABC transporter substrate-binding protein [Fimbriimonadales bacterium]
MKKTLVIATLALLALPAFANLNVVTTTQDLASIAKSIGGSNVTVTALVVGARDPHRLDAKPSYMSLLAKADLYVAIGLDLEIGYEEAILKGSRNSKVQRGGKGHVHAGDWAVVLDRPSGSVSRSQGDIHPYGNPHVWLDPYNGRLIATKLGEKMAGLDPANAEKYRANARSFASELDKRMFGSALVTAYGADNLWTWTRNKQLHATLKIKGTFEDLSGWAGKMAPYVGQKVITYHRSWTYFMERFSLFVAEELEPKPGIDPTPSHLASVVNIVKQQTVRVVLQEPFYSTRNAKFVADRTDAKVVVAAASVGQTADAKDYFSLFDSLVSKVAEGLKR